MLMVFVMAVGGVASASPMPSDIIGEVEYMLIDNKGCLIDLIKDTPGSIKNKYINFYDNDGKWVAVGEIIGIGTNEKDGITRAAAKIVVRWNKGDKSSDMTHYKVSINSNRSGSRL